MRSRRERIYYGILLGMLVCIAAACVFIVMRKDCYSLQSDEETSVRLTKDWFLETAEGKLPVTLPYSVHGEGAGQEVRLSVRLPEQEEAITDAGLLLSCDYLNLTVQLDGEEIYRCEVPENGITKTAGSFFVLADLPENWQGKELTLSYTTLLEGKRLYEVSVPVLGGKAEILVGILRDNLFSIIFNLFLLLVGAALLAFHFFGKQWKSYNSNFFMLGMFAIFAAGYLICETEWVRLYVHNVYLIYVLEYTFLMLLILPLLLLIQSNMKSRMMGFLKVVSTLAIVNFFVMYLLHFGFQIDFKRTIIGTHVMLVLGIVAMLCVLATTDKSKRPQQRENLLTLVPLALGGGLDILIYYFRYEAVGLNAFRVGIFFFVILQAYYNYKRVLELSRARYEARLYKKMAYTDTMTGLANRAAYERDLKELEKKKGEESVCVLSVDVNHLKEVNDTLGHSAGDELIIHTADILKRGVAGDGCVYRTGGDEYIILLVGCTEETVAAVEARIKEERARFKETGKTAVSFSLGKAYYDKEQDADMEKTVARADHNMYERKREYKACLQDAMRNPCNSY